MEGSRRTVLRTIAASLVALGLLTGLGVVLVYQNWNNNLEHPRVVGKNRPEKETTALNILVMGTDSRSCEGCRIDEEAGGGLSDTTILFHLSANREFAYGISIPRDTAVMRPTCYRADDSEIPAATAYDKWNVAFQVGGPGCTRQQLEQLTGIHVDKFVVVDFNQFKDMVDALDGVEICVPEEIDDTTGNIHLDAGTREVDGEEALAYARVRYGISGGIDPYRTRRQQALIGAMIDKALTRGMLARPDRLAGFISAATTDLQTDFKSVAAMAKVAASAQSIDAADIKFITTPWTLETDKVSGGVEWLPSVERLWRLVIEDRPLTREFLGQAISAGDSPDGSGASGTPGSASAPPTGSASVPTASSHATPSPDPSSDPSGGTSGGLSDDDRAAAGLCS
jgi:LCP family protein required for cell wall assembly